MTESRQSLVAYRSSCQLSIMYSFINASSSLYILVKHQAGRGNKNWWKESDTELMIQLLAAVSETFSKLDLT